jgi:uncharacterized protein YaeQ
MAQKATIYKAELEIADIDRGHYGSHALTLARHPSETEERLMVRLLAFALHAGDGLEFGRGLSTDDEPDLWRKDATGAVLQWIEVGLPDERRLRRATGRAREVGVVAYGRRALDTWWQANRAAFERLPSLSVRVLAADDTAALAGMAARNMHLQCTIQDGHVVISDARTVVTLEPIVLLAG